MKTKRRDVDETKLNFDDQSGAPCIHECSVIHGNVALGDGKAKSGASARKSCLKSCRAWRMVTRRRPQNEALL